jgi:hypothetical protein
VVALEEGATIDERLAPQLGQHYKQQAQRRRDYIAVLKNMLSKSESGGAADRFDGRASGGEDQPSSRQTK